MAYKSCSCGAHNERERVSCWCCGKRFEDEWAKLEKPPENKGPRHIQFDLLADEGGQWTSYLGHAIRTPDGKVFDAVNGWRKQPETFKSQEGSMLDTPFLKHADKLQGDTIVHPTHYSRWAMEPIEFIAINDLPWWLANVVKYTMRYDAKNGLEDLYKARSYLEMKIRQLEGVKRFWDKPVSEERKLNGK